MPSFPKIPPGPHRCWGSRHPLHRHPPSPLHMQTPPPAPSPALSPQSAVPGPATLCPADYRWLRAFGFPPWTAPEEASLLVAGRAHNPLWGQTLRPVPTLPGQPPAKYSHAPSQTWPPLSAALNHFPTEKLLRLPMPGNEIHSGTTIKGFCKTWLKFPAHFQPFHGSPASVLEPGQTVPVPNTPHPPSRSACLCAFAQAAWNAAALLPIPFNRPPGKQVLNLQNPCAIPLVQEASPEPGWVLQEWLTSARPVSLDSGPPSGTVLLGLNTSTTAHGAPVCSATGFHRTWELSMVYTWLNG